ncbi:MAG: hypothetical protein AAB425_14810, partial [Bdellovibrionota bacterium]
MTVLTTHARSSVCDFWKSHLNCDAVGTEAAEGHVAVVPHGPVFGEYNGVFAFKWGKGLVVTVPERISKEMASLIGRQVKARGVDSVFDSKYLQEVFGTTVDRLIGPAYYGYLSARSEDANFVVPTPEFETRELGAADRDRLDQFSGEIGQEDWELSGLDPNRTKHIFGILDPKGSLFAI